MVEYLDDENLDKLYQELRTMICVRELDPNRRAGLIHDLGVAINQAKLMNQAYKMMEATNKLLRDNVEQAEKALEESRKIREGK